MPFIALGLFGLYTLEFGVIGILPVIVERFHVSVSRAGLLVGFFALIVAACGPLLVLFTSRFNRKAVLCWTLFGFSICSALTAFAPSFHFLIALRVLPALLHPVFFSAAFATAGSLYPPGRTAQATTRAFVGTTLGMVFGVPMTTWVAARFGYEASFLFCAAVTSVAGLGLMAKLPSPHAPEPLSFVGQLSVLKKFSLWLNILATVMVFAAGFAVYSYAAAYLKQQTGMDGQTISAMLVVFGLGGFAGNLLGGQLLSRSLLKTVLMYPVVLSAAYLALVVWSSASIPAMVAISLFWGAAHTSGLVVTQTWLTSVASEVPEFANSLYLSAANAGVVLGAYVGGLFIEEFGMHGVVRCGLLFALLALLAIALKASLFGVGSSRPGTARLVGNNGAQ